MSKHKKQNTPSKRAAAPAPDLPRKRGLWLLLAVAVVAVGVVSVAVVMNKSGRSTQAAFTATNTAASKAAALVSASLATQSPARAASQTNTNAFAVMEVNKAIMVTVELDFGPKIPTIAEALRDVERRYQPDDGQGRTFAVLDAYGEPTPDGKKLHMSMHVSTEKPGVGTLVFRRTGEVLWQSRIIASTNAAHFTGKNLLVLLDDGAGKTVTVDGSNNPATVLQAMVKEAGVPVSLFWPDGAEREVTFLYSACGCPVKAMVKRVGDRTVRTKELPVIFPDDPAVVSVITRLMAW